MAYDLELERQAIQQYTERLHEIEATWAIALKVRLERILADEAEHERRFREFLDQHPAPQRA